MAWGAYSLLNKDPSRSYSDLKEDLEKVRKKRKNETFTIGFRNPQFCSWFVPGMEQLHKFGTENMV